METKNYVGWMHVITNSIFDPNENPKATEEYWFETDKQEFFLVFFRSLEQKLAIPLNTKIAISFEVDDLYVVAPIRPWFVLVNDIAAAPISTRQKKHIAIWKRIAPGSSKEDHQKAQAKVHETAQRVKSFWSTQDVQNIWDIDVRGFVFEGSDDTSPIRPPTWGLSDIEEAKKDMNMHGFVPNYIHTIGGNSSLCGQADVGGPYSATYADSSYACDDFTTIHELGHCFGIHHASTRDATGRTKEYGDTTDLMAAHSRTGLNAPHRHQLGLESDRETHIVTSSEQVLIAPLELSKRDLHDNEHQTVIIPGKRRGEPNYYVSVRKSVGDYALSSNYQKVFIHEFMPNGRAERTVRLLPDLRPGETKELPNGVKVTFVHQYGEIAKVNIWNTDDVITNAEEFNSAIFPARLPNAEFIKEGAWYNPKHSGQGFDIFINGNTWGMTWYTYTMENDSYGGGLRFFYANGLVDDDKPFTIYTTEGGTQAHPILATERIVGSGQFSFYDDNNGVFFYNLEATGKGSFPIKPVSTKVSNHPWNGIYFNPSRTGEGFTVRVHERKDRDEISVICYTYGEPAIDGRYRQPIPGTSQRWYFMLGSFAPGDNLVHLHVYEPTGGRFVTARDVKYNLIGECWFEVFNKQFWFKELQEAGGIFGNLDSLRMSRLL